MIRVREAIVVEGRYDKDTLRQVVDAPIFETGGFRVMHDKTLLDFLRRVAEERGLIVLTDSDGAGFVIRNYLKGALPEGRVLHAYIPDIYGKEKRKRSRGKEGKLGVEGMRPEVLCEALRRAGATIEGEDGAGPCRERITKQDLYELGLTGMQGSVGRRVQLQRELGLPERMGANALLDVLDVLFTREAFLERYAERTGGSE